MLEVLSLLMQQCLFFLGYITGRSEFPKSLSREEEATLITRMEQGDHEARQELIAHNLRLVSHIAHKYQIPGYGADDLISIGVIGLIKAVDSFKSSSGTALGTYAARCIENEILMTLRASRKRRNDVSLSDPVGSDGEGNEITYQDILGTEPDALEETVIRRVTIRHVQRVLHHLPPRERLVLELRYGLTDGKQHPQHEIARRLGISRSYVSHRAYCKRCPKVMLEAFGHRSFCTQRRPSIIANNDFRISSLSRRCHYDSHHPRPRQPERWRGQDHYDRQLGRWPRAAGQESPAGGLRPAGQPDH